MKKILFIAYNYPPAGGSGVQRDAKFAKYLPEYGWQPIILTPDHRLLKQARDYTLSQELSSQQPVYRTFTIDIRWFYKVLWGLKLNRLVTWLNYTLFIPDPEILWLPFAKRKIHQIMKHHTPKLVFISGPPFSPMLLGTWIKNRYGIPFVMSLRDDWSLNQSRLDNPPPPSFSARDCHYEKIAVFDASLVITINQPCRENLLKMYPQLPEEKIRVITNGYDEADFACSAKSYEKSEHFLRIVHTGALYGRRNPEKIWQALLELVRYKLIDPANIRIDLFGQNYRSFVFRGFEQNDVLQSMVQLHPYLPHEQSIQALLQADLLLLFIGHGPNSHAVSTGKIFEYMRAGKPILAVVDPEGTAAELVMRSHSGMIADNGSVEDIKKQLLSTYQKWHCQELEITPDWDYIRQFERCQLSSKLASCFNEIVPSS